MRVYKFEAHHGGGHQSHTVEYRVYDWEDADYDWDADEQYMLEDWSQQFNNVRSTIELLDPVPIDVLAELIGRYFQRAKTAKVTLLKLLALPGADTRMYQPEPRSKPSKPSCSLPRPARITFHQMWMRRYGQY